MDAIYRQMGLDTQAVNAFLKAQSDKASDQGLSPENVWAADYMGLDRAAMADHLRQAGRAGPTARSPMPGGGNSENDLINANR